MLFINKPENVIKEVQLYRKKVYRGLKKLFYICKVWFFRDRLQVSLLILSEFKRIN